MSSKPSTNAVAALEYFDQNGLMVISTAFLLKQGKCCKNSCRNCPYGYFKNDGKPINMHSYPLRVDFCALDRGGDVYHPRYLNYLDRARVLMFEEGGCEAPALFKNGLKWRVKSCSMQFHKELNWQDHGRVLTEITYVGKSEFSCKQWIISTPSKPELANISPEDATFFANTTVELCDLEGKTPAQIPEDFKKVLNQHSS